MQFLVERVWNIHSPVNIIDFGCGMGYAGARLLPLLPAGSTYTGLDKGKTLLSKAAEFFSDSGYNTVFYEVDLLEYRPEKKYDIAICHTVLQHIPSSMRIIEKMRDSVICGGKVICIEIDRNIANAGLYFHGVDYSRLNNLGILQKLWQKDLWSEGSDHNIGIKVPAYMQEAGLKDIGVRINDCVNFINAKGDKSKYETEYDCFISAGWGGGEKNRDEFVDSMIKRGLTREEANYQFDCETMLNTYVNDNKDSMCIVSAPCLIVSYGTV